MYPAFQSNGETGTVDLRKQAGFRPLFPKQFHSYMSGFSNYPMLKNPIIR
jgi:hypothetical protein